jgi:DNA-binding response OmpR family regulator
MNAGTKINKTAKSDHILVIDDDEFLLGAIRKKLELSNYRVSISNNVRDASFKLGMIVKPDLILLDIIMPGISGLDFLPTLNYLFSYSTVPVILMSGLSPKHLNEMGYSLGKTAYIPKPFDINQLPAIIDNTLKEQNTGLRI